MKSKLIKFGAIASTVLVLALSIYVFFIAPYFANPGDMIERVQHIEKGEATSIDVNCNRDRDGNGYARCSASYKLNGKNKEISAECPTGLFTWGDKCQTLKVGR